jgi:hypothetical protein
MTRAMCSYVRARFFRFSLNALLLPLAPTIDVSSTRRYDLAISRFDIAFRFSSLFIIERSSAGEK